jgi:hypothetical protein
MIPVSQPEHRTHIAATHGLRDMGWSFAIITLLSLAFGGLSCAPDGKKKDIVESGHLADGKRYELRRVHTDPRVDMVGTVFYPNSDSIYEEYTIKDNKRSGPDYYYTFSAKRFMSKFWENNHKIYVRHYDTVIDKKTFEQDYFAVGDTDVENGYKTYDTSGNIVIPKSFAMVYDSERDTIWNGRTYRMGLNLFAPLYRNAYVRISCCGNSHDTSSYRLCDSLNMDHLKIFHEITSYHPGCNSVGGEIVNYEYDKDPRTGKMVRKEARLFFAGDFYVKTSH